MKVLSSITVFAAAMAIVSAADVHAGVILEVGDLIVTDIDTDALIHVDPDSGAQTLITSGEPMMLPKHVAYSPDGSIVVYTAELLTDFGTYEEYVGRIIQVDPPTGAQSFLTGIFAPATGAITVARDGYIWATNEWSVARIDPATGDRETICFFGDGMGAGIVEAMVGGELTIVYTHVQAADDPALIDCLSDTGEEILATSGDFNISNGMEVNLNGRILNFGDDGSVLETDLDAGLTTTLFSGGLLTATPRFGADLAVSLEGYIYVTQGDRIVKIDQTSGAQSIVSSEGLFTDIRGIAVVTNLPPRDVDIDIKPGSYPNKVNLRSKGNIPVAILTTDTFDATQVDWETVLFGPDGATESHSRAHVGDVDDDGDMDLLLHFNTPETGIACGDTEAALTGATFDGAVISGTDSIEIVKCH